MTIDKCIFSSCFLLSHCVHIDQGRKIILRYPNNTYVLYNDETSGYVTIETYIENNDAAKDIEFKIFNDILYQTLLSYKIGFKYISSCSMSGNENILLKRDLPLARGQKMNVNIIFESLRQAKKIQNRHICALYFDYLYNDDCFYKILCLYKILDLYTKEKPTEFLKNALKSFQWDRHLMKYVENRNVNQLVEFLRKEGRNAVAHSVLKSGNPLESRNIDDFERAMIVSRVLSKVIETEIIFGENTGINSKYDQNK